MEYEELLKHPPYKSPDANKSALLKPALAQAFEHHYNNCPEYRRFCRKQGIVPPLADFTYQQLPYLPVGIFKELSLKSVSSDKIVRTLHSSATTTQIPSTVYLDNVTRGRQVKTLTWLLADYLGRERRPFLIMDVDPHVVPDGQHAITARAAAIRGFLLAANPVHYCMTVDREGRMRLDVELLKQRLAECEKRGGDFVLFGYTYVLYAYFAEQLRRENVRFTLPRATIVHIGGWKKLASEAVSRRVFNETLTEVLGVSADRIVDVYGFTEQLGVIYPDAGTEHKRCPLVSEVIVRDPTTLEPVPDGHPGLLEFITPLPTSYPGIAVLLDDIGRVVSREQSPCGRFGTAFEILGRAKMSEVRGCGDILSGMMEGKR